MSAETVAVDSSGAGNSKVAKETGCKFNLKWKTEYFWINYDNHNDKVFCKVCSEAISKKIICSENLPAMAKKID